jgi:hypothetical protein
MALNNSPDHAWTGVFRMAPKTDNDGNPIAAGLRLPLLTTTERDAMTEVEEGTLIYNTSDHKVQVRVDDGWETVTSA